VVISPSRARCAIAGLLPLCSLAVAQQQGSIRGLVTDKEFEVPVGAASVLVVETGQKTLTNDQGNYVLPDVPAGRYTLVFAKDGYVRQVVADVVVAAGRLTDVDLDLSGDFTDMEEFLVHDALALAATTVVALLQMRLESPAMMDSVGADLMSRAGASDAAGALRLVAGASVPDGKTAVIRGLPDRYVSAQMNGVRLPTANEDKRAVELDQFPAEVLDSIQVSKTFTPDQQGDASGGAVDVRLKAVPADPFFFQWKVQTSHNTQVTGRGSFLSYEGGGVHFWGKDQGQRAPQLDLLGENWDGAVGSQVVEAPMDYKWSGAFGGSTEIADGVRFGGFFSFFHEHDSSLSRGVDDTYWVESPGGPMTPKTVQGTVGDGDFKTALFDVTRASQSIQWGTLATVGLETEHHAINLVHLYTRTAEDNVTLAEDTRGKQYFFPGYDPTNQNSPGFYEFNAAPYLRLETLEYTERTTETLQLNGRHRIAASSFARNLAPELDWVVALSSAGMLQPDKRQFGALWTPGADLGSIQIPPAYSPFKPSANFTLGNLQRIWKEIDEDSEQGALNFKMPFELGKGRKGYVKTGFFHDKVERRFDQETYSNFGDNSSWNGPWELPWSRVFPTQNHPISASTLDVDYTGNQQLDAIYAMLDLPLTKDLSLVGGVRFESTEIGIRNDAEADATWLPPSTNVPTALRPGDADVDFAQDDVLPSLGLVWEPLDGLTFRAAYNETVARQTFKELSPIQQQEYLGGPVFVGNPDLQMSSLRNYDLRVDWSPRSGSLLSASWFRKDIDGPIEYVQRISSFDYTTAVNYPRGTLEGIEFEAREGLGNLWPVLDGLSIGGNATLIDSSVRLPDDEIHAFSAPNLQAPMSTRDMTNTPEHLYNLFLTYDVPKLGTRLGLFYTVTGDSLVAGAGESNGNYVPSVYAVEYDRLNFSLSQPFGPHLRLTFQAKNLTNPVRREVYRSEYIGDDVTKTSYSEGVEYSLGIGGEIRF
jgi:outer membrane receptor protein involved in Fe transport